MPRRGRTYSGPVVDIHTHLHLPELSPVRAGAFGPTDYLRAARGVDLRWAGVLAMAPRRDPKATRRRNDAVLALARAHPDRFYAVGSVHPLDGAPALAEIDRLASAGARGLKLHPNTQAFDVADPRVEAVVRRAAERRLPVLFDAYSPFDAGQPGKFVRLALAVPESQIVLAHAHGPRYPELLVYPVLARYPWWHRNVWIDVSATGPFLAGGPFAPTFRWVLRQVGVDRVLFGSDYPLDPLGPAVRAVAGLGFTRSELERIFWRNAGALYRLKVAAHRWRPRSARPQI